MARRVLVAEVSGGRVQGRPRLGWMDGVKVALGNRGMTVEAVRQCAKDRKEWRALLHMLLIIYVPRHCVILDHPPVLWWLSQVFHDGLLLGRSFWCPFLCICNYRNALYCKKIGRSGEPSVLRPMLSCTSSNKLCRGKNNRVPKKLDNPKNEQTL